MLNELDKELTRRGHLFVRYADDSMIFCRSKSAAKQTKESITRFIEGKLHLRVNKEKTTVSYVKGVKYLGYSFYNSKGKFELCVHSKSKVKMKLRLKELTGRSNGMGYERRKQKLKEYIRGWIGYYHLANMKRLLLETDEWLRRRIRMCIWKSWKNPKTRISNLIRCGISKRKANEWGYTRLYDLNKFNNMKYRIKLIITCFILGQFLFSCSDKELIEEPPTVEEPTPEPKPEPEPDPEPEPIVTLPELHVDGRYLKNAEGEIVNLHGFTQTYSPFFNSNRWSNYDVNGCLSYNKRMVDEILDAGWKFNFVRMHLDPYWSDDPNKPSVRYEGHERFSEVRFRKYLDELFVPMAEYFLSKGMYVVMRPPGVCPNGEGYEGIEIGDTYQEFLLKVWDIVSKHSKLKNNTGIMFELANEPVNIKGTDGKFGSSGEACFANMKEYFQAIVDKIRSNNSNNIIWVPGLAYQSSYAGYATHRIEGENIGFAVHCYPGWYGSDAEEDSSEGIGSSTGGGYEAFQRGWDAQVGPVAEFAPIMVTEIDWAPKKYDATWGKSITGEAGGKGFGANFKYIADKSGNVSWLFFTTDSEMLAAFEDIPGELGNYTFLNDPEACPWPMYHWFKEYAEGVVVNGELERLEFVGTPDNIELVMGDAEYINVKAVYSDGSTRMITHEVTLASSDDSVVKVDGVGKIVAVSEGQATLTISYVTDSQDRKELSVSVKVLSPFILKEEFFNPSIWEDGSFDEETSTLITGKYGFGGWQYADGLDLHEYSSIRVELASPNDCGASFRLFDQNSYWTSPAMYDFGSSTVINVNLQNMTNAEGIKLDPSHLYIVGFWSTGGKPITIKSISLNK